MIVSRFLASLEEGDNYNADINYDEGINYDANINYDEDNIFLVGQYYKKIQKRVKISIVQYDYYKSIIDNIQNENYTISNSKL